MSDPLGSHRPPSQGQFPTGGLSDPSTAPQSETSGVPDVHVSNISRGQGDGPDGGLNHCDQRKTAAGVEETFIYLDLSGSDVKLLPGVKLEVQVRIQANLERESPSRRTVLCVPPSALPRLAVTWRLVRSKPDQLS